MLDLDRAAVVAGESLVGACDAVLVVAPRDLRTVAGVLAMRPHLGAPGVPTWLVVRGPAPGGLGAAELSDAVDLPILARSRRTAGWRPPSSAAGCPTPAGRPARRLASSARSHRGLA